ncbi:MAG: sugar kinase [Saprospirales bacterium]|nr:sugar kinase [Saprospirales bacterium]MBK8919990.1 sugar kinase [Saprospirales bacterium]
MGRAIDIFCAGELLVDFATAEFVRTPDEATLFRRIPGGSPANLSMNMARLGNSAMLAATVGNDDMGNVLKNYVARLGVDVSCVAQVDEPTTLFLEMRTSGSSSLQTYRTADYMMSIRQFPYSRFEDIAIFYTTCFALSKNPAQHVIMEAAEKAHRAGVQLSIDANFSEKIWPERREAQRILAEYCRMGAIIKISDSDYLNLYGEDKPAPESVVDQFLRMGANEVCYTLGANGCWVGDEHGSHFVPARPVDIKDPIGAGDAFWAGYLTAFLEGKPLETCAKAGRQLAELKIGNFGPLPDQLDRSFLYAGH